MGGVYLGLLGPELGLGLVIRGLGLGLLGGLKAMLGLLISDLSVPGRYSSLDSTDLEGTSSDLACLGSRVVCGASGVIRGVPGPLPSLVSLGTSTVIPPLPLAAVLGLNIILTGSGDFGLEEIWNTILDWESERVSW
jgi:hypothetical protein